MATGTIQQPRQLRAEIIGRAPTANTTVNAHSILDYSLNVASRANTVGYSAIWSGSVSCFISNIYVSGSTNMVTVTISNVTDSAVTLSTGQQVRIMRLYYE